MLTMAARALPLPDGDGLPSYLREDMQGETGSQMDDDTLLLTVRETMRLLRVGSRNTLWEWERRGHGPKPVSIGRPGAQHRTLRYRRTDLVDWIGGRS